jgi:ABC-type oligopeptide transport system substrate-binding subunit
MTKRIVALLGVAALVLAACSPASPSTGPVGSGGQGSSAPGATGGALAADQVLKEYLSDTDPASMSPTAANDSVSIAVQQAVYRGLLYYDKDLNLVPEMATALPDVSSDGKTLTFTLKDGLKYSDGNPIVAGDFVRAFQRLADPLAANFYGYEACPIVGADALLGVEGGCPTDKHAAKDAASVAELQKSLGVKAPDDKTVVITLSTPAAYYSSILAMWLTVPQEESMTKFVEATDLVASGPFMVKDWTHNSQITLVPNPNWTLDPKPTLTEIDMMIGGDPEAALASYEQGAIDLVPVPSPDVTRIKADTSLTAEYSEAPALGITYYGFNVCNKQAVPKATCPKNNTSDGRLATTNKNFRIALTEAIDKQDFINITFAGLGIVANSEIMPGVPGYDKDLNPYPFDLAKAKTDMATAIQELGVTDTNKDGAVDVKDIGTIKFGYNCNAGHLPRVVYLAEHWRTAFGFDQNQFDLSCVTFPELLQQRPLGVFQINRDGWNADFPGAVNQLDGLFTCGGGNNDEVYCNPDFDNALKAAEAEADPTKAVAAYQAAQKILVEDAPVIWLRFAVTPWLVKPYVSGVVATSNDSQNIGDKFPETISILQH